MTDPDPLEQRLAALGDAAPAALAPAGTVRARGDRRRRRTRVALAGLAVVAAAGAGGGAAVLTGARTTDALQQAGPTAEPEPAACAELGLPTAPEDGEVVVFGGDDRDDGSELSCSLDPSPSPSAVAKGPPPVPEPTTVTPPAPTAPPPAPTPPAPSPAPVAPWSPAAAFLSPEAATRAEGSAWQVDEGHGERVEPGPLVDPCRTGTYTDPPDEQSQRSLFAASEYGGGGLLQRVTRFGDSADADRAFEAVVASFARCPEEPADDAGLVYRYDVQEQQGDAGAQTALVQVSHCRDGSCEGLYRSFLLLAVAGDGLTEVHYGGGGDATPSDPARPLLAAVADALLRATR